MIKIENTVTGDKYEFESYMFSGIESKGIKAGGTSSCPQDDMTMLAALYVEIRDRVCRFVEISSEDFDEVIFSGINMVEEKVREKIDQNTNL